ncbi:hypothetical protein SK128_010948, partial [Halocaridina rubra]
DLHAMLPKRGDEGDKRPNIWYKLMSYLLIAYLFVCVIISLMTPLFLTPYLKVDLMMIVMMYNNVIITSSSSFPLLHASSFCIATSTLYHRLSQCIKGISDGSAVMDSGSTNREVSTGPSSFQLSADADLSAEMWVNLGGEFKGIIFPLLNGLINLISLSILAWAVDFLRAKHESTTEAVHSCRTDLKAVDDSTVNALQLFSLQLLHSTPELSVAGFFAVDRTLILAVRT